MPSLPGIVASGVVPVDWSAQTLYVHGHSWYAADIMNSGPSTRAINQLNTRLGFASFNNFAVSSSQAADCALRVHGNGSSKWTPGQAGYALFDSFLNDTRQVDVAQSRTSGANGLRAFVRGVIAASKVEQTTGTRSSGWTLFSDNTYSGGSLHFTTTEGAYIEYTVTPGTLWYLGLAQIGASPGFTGGQFTFTLNGSPVGGTMELNQQLENTLLGLAQGALTYELTIGSSGTLRATYTKASRSGTVYGHADALLSAPTSAPARPRVILVKPVELPSGGGQTPALLTYYRDLVDTVAAEYPGWVKVCDPSTGWNPVTMIGADKIHPNDTGMTHLADALEATFRSI